VALDLLDAGWDLRYVPDVVAHQEPSPVRDPRRRERAEVCNVLLTAWRRLPARPAARVTLAEFRGSSPRAVLEGTWDALRRWPSVRTDRRVVAPHVVRELALLLPSKRALRQAGRPGVSHARRSASLCRPPDRGG